MSIKFKNLNNTIVKCKKCPRLVKFIKKITNQSTSENLKDGLKLNSTYITNILKCVPPGDKPLNKELNNCSEYFDLEIYNLKNLKIIITLGKLLLIIV